MDWLTPNVAAIAGAAISALGAGVLSRLRLSDRLRHRAQTELDMLAKLPPNTQAHAALSDHIERQVLLLVAEEEPLGSWERNDRLWGYLILGIGVMSAWSVLEKPNFPYRTVWIVAFTILALYGFERTARVSRAQNSRRLRKRFAADPPQAIEPGHGVRMLKAFWRRWVIRQLDEEG